MGWVAVCALGPSIVPPRVIPRIYTYVKKLLRYPKTRARFWVNAQCAYLVTRKPLNVRMGKGKGAKVRLYTAFRGGVTLAALSALRAGLQVRLRRFISIRLGRPTLLLQPTAVIPGWVQRHRTQVRLLRARAREVKMLLTLIRRPALRIFFNRLFRRAWKRPRLRWRFRWPALPRRSARLRSKKRKWGLGVRYTAPL